LQPSFFFFKTQVFNNLFLLSTPLLLINLDVYLDVLILWYERVREERVKEERSTRESENFFHLTSEEREKRDLKWMGSTTFYLLSWYAKKGRRTNFLF